MYFSLQCKSKHKICGEDLNPTDLFHCMDDLTILFLNDGKQAEYNDIHKQQLTMKEVCFGRVLNATS